jgi:hypothetical protein
MLARSAGRAPSFNPGEGWVDLPSLIDLLLAEFRARGGRLVDARAQINVTAGRARGVVTLTDRRSKETPCFSR